MSFSELRTLLTDPAYLRLFAKAFGQFGLSRAWETCVKAGFIDEQRSIWPLTDFARSMDSKADLGVKSGVILVMTGCFAPVHEGHVDALEQARTVLESMGTPVLRGYLAACHSDYVATKTANFYDDIDGERLIQMRKFLHTRAPWIRPCMWEAEQRHPLNFTTVYRAFQRYFASQQVVYVYGSDNENFRLAFLDGALNICVRRTQPSKDEPYRCYLTNWMKTNTLYVYGSDATRSLSSSQLRATA